MRDTAPQDDEPHLHDAGRLQIDPTSPNKPFRELTQPEVGIEFVDTWGSQQRSGSTRPLVRVTTEASKPSKRELDPHELMRQEARKTRYAGTGFDPGAGGRCLRESDSWQKERIRNNGGCGGSASTKCIQRKLSRPVKHGVATKCVSGARFSFNAACPLVSGFRVVSGGFRVASGGFRFCTMVSCGFRFLSLVSVWFAVISVGFQSPVVASERKQCSKTERALRTQAPWLPVNAILSDTDFENAEFLSE